MLLCNTVIKLIFSPSGRIHPSYYEAMGRLSTQWNVVSLTCWVFFNTCSSILWTVYANAVIILLWLPCLSLSLLFSMSLSTVLLINSGSVCLKVAFVAVDLRIDCFQNQGGTVQYVLKLHLICRRGLQKRLFSKARLFSWIKLFS